jgi:hypothetical protein
MRATAPEELRNRLRGLSTKELVSVAARFRLADGPRDVPTATRFALRSVARRYEALSEEIDELEAHLDRLVAQAAPELLSLPGIGTDNAATLLVVALKTTLGGWGARPPSPVCAGSLPSRPPPPRSSATVSTEEATGRPEQCVVHDLPVPDAPGSSHAAIRREAHTGGQEQAGDHPLPKALRSPGGLPCADLLRRTFLADESERGGPDRRREQRRLTIGASLR